MNNINGGGGRRGGLSSVDFYRRVPRDLTEVSFCHPQKAFVKLCSFCTGFYVEAHRK